MLVKDKFEEARFFLGCMASCTENPDFRYYLSAFLSAARSVLQYTHTEAMKQQKQCWYDQQVGGNKILDFFKCQRNINIHQHPVASKLTISAIDSVQVTDSLKVTVRRSDGTREIYEDPPTPPEPPKTVETTTKWRFVDWKGCECILKLSNLYLSELSAFLKAARAKGIIK